MGEIQDKCGTEHPNSPFYDGRHDEVVADKCHYCNEPMDETPITVVDIAGVEHKMCIPCFEHDDFDGKCRDCGSYEFTHLAGDRLQCTKCSFVANWTDFFMI